MLVAEMTWHEYRDRVERSVIFLPVGATEQHGPHLPLGVDTILPSKVAALVAEEIDAMVLPTIPYGYKSQPGSGGGQLFPGTTSLNGSTLVNVILDVLRETYRHGGRKFVVFNGHYENTMFITEAADLFVNTSKDARVMLLDWTTLLSDEMVDELFADCGFPGWDLEHAAVTETSLMQYFAPQLVREDKIIDDQFEQQPLYAIFPPDPDRIPKSGVLYRATFASREKGEKLVKHVVPKIAQVVRQEFGL
jgi:creatinine amidohydrolase